MNLGDKMRLANTKRGKKRGVSKVTIKGYDYFRAYIVYKKKKRVYETIGYFKTHGEAVNAFKTRFNELFGYIPY